MRRLRVHFPGAVYHVWDRGVDRRVIFEDDYDRVIFLEALNRIVQDTGATLLAYCLMGNHFHLALQVGTIPLAAIMHRLLTGYCMAFNLRRHRVGHLFQGRYRSNVCLDDAYLTALIRYIHQNPVRAGLVNKAADWPWSTLSLRPDPGADEVLEGFDPWLNAADQVTEMKRLAENAPVPIEEIAARVCAEAGISIGELRSPARKRSLVAARAKFTRAMIESGRTLRFIADWLYTTPSTVTRYSRSSNNANTGRPDP